MARRYRLIAQRLHPGELYLAPNVITYSAAVRSCEKGQQPHTAMIVLTSIQCQDVAPNIITDRQIDRQRQTDRGRQTQRPAILESIGIESGGS